MINKNKIRNFLKSGTAIMICVLLVVTAFSAAAGFLPNTANGNNGVDKTAESKEAGFESHKEPFANGKTGVTLLKSDSSGILLRLNCNRRDLLEEEVEVDNIVYQKIGIPGWSSTNEIGKPQLPTQLVKLAIPDKVTPILEVIKAEYSVLSDFVVYPVPKPVEKEDADGYAYIDFEFEIDEEFYSKDLFYPDNTIGVVSISNIRDVRVAQMEFVPFQYNPTTKELRIYSSLLIKLTYDHPQELVMKDAGPFSGICERNILNYDAPPSNVMKKTPRDEGMVTYPDDLYDPNNTADYLIITNDTFYIPARENHTNGAPDNMLNNLAYHRADYNGFDVAVVSVDDLNGVTDEDIKDFIEYVYDNWDAPHMNDNHVGFLLIVGDTPFVTSHDISDNGISDRWYVCMDGDTDRYPDIMIGRFSVDDDAELDIIADKTIYYEQNYNDSHDWHKHVLLCEGERDWPHEDGNNFPEYKMVTDVLLKLGGWNVSEVFCEEGGTDVDVINNINDGRSIVVYCDHGGWCGWSCLGFSCSDIQQLSNGYKLSLVYSLACHTGSFQKTDDCMGEVFLNHSNGGAVAFWGASKVTGAGSFHFFEYLFESIFENFTYIIGEIITEGIIQLNGNYPEYNLLGDPALDLSDSTKYPEKPDLTLSHLNITTSPEYVTVDDEEVNITATVLNIGGDTATNVTVRFLYKYRDGEQHIINDHVVPEIQPGDHNVLVQPWDISELAGKKSLIIQIDPNDDVDEAFELNNQAGIKVIIFSDVTYVDAENTEGPWDGTFEHPYRILQDGVDSVIPDGTVYVSNGTYVENIVIDKTINLIGEEKYSTIIDAGGCGNVIKITGDQVNISNFTIQNSGNDYYDAGIVLKGSKLGNISGNIIKNNNYGICLRTGSGQVNPSDTTFTGNTITTNDYGIYLQGSHKNTFTRNTIMVNNYGIYIKGMVYGWSTDNIFMDNDIAYNNVCGIKIVGCSRNNHIYHNNFINNYQSAYDEISNTWYNDTFQEGNYWSDYTDQYPDPKDDDPPCGIWDEPYDISGKNPPNQDVYPLVDPWSLIPGDLDGDSDVDQSDLGIFLAAWGTEPGDQFWTPRADINNDGYVDQSDLGILLSNWGYGT